MLGARDGIRIHGHTLSKSGLSAATYVCCTQKTVSYHDSNPTEPQPICRERRASVCLLSMIPPRLPWGSKNLTAVIRILKGGLGILEHEVKDCLLPKSNRIQVARERGLSGQAKRSA